jgi:hypothetical protein
VIASIYARFGTVAIGLGESASVSPEAAAGACPMRIRASYFLERGAVERRSMRSCGVAQIASTLNSSMRRREPHNSSCSLTRHYGQVSLRNIMPSAA